MKEDCIFCRIAGRAADATVVYEDSQTLAFLDIHPLNPGHTLVIPKKHFTNMLEMPAEQTGRLGPMGLQISWPNLTKTSLSGSQSFLSTIRVSSRSVSSGVLVLTAPIRLKILWT